MTFELETECPGGLVFARSRTRQPVNPTILLDGAVPVAALVQRDRQIQLRLEKRGVLRDRALEERNGFCGALLLDEHDAKAIGRVAQCRIEVERATIRRTCLLETRGGTIGVAEIRQV